MATEIERKFLVNRELWEQVEKPHPISIKQGYFHTTPGKSIRIRQMDDSSFLTIKSGSASLSRSEFEYKIPTDDARQLLESFCDATLSKKRYPVLYKGKTWEIDVFEGQHEGLILAEIELDSETEIVDIPAWAEREVTGDPRFYNEHLAFGKDFEPPASMG